MDLFPVSLLRFPRQRRWALILCIAAAVVSALALLPSRASSASSSSYTIPMEIRDIIAVVPLRKGHHGRALALYRRLVPSGYSVPRDRAVEIYLTEPNVPTIVPGQGYNGYSRWIEGAFALRVSYRGHEGWFPLGMPLNSSFEYQLGRAAGLPKYMGSASLNRLGSGYQATETVAGKVTQQLTWTPDATAAIPPLEKAALSQGGSPLYALNPALVGPSLEETHFQPQPPPGMALAAPQPGMVNIRVDPRMSDWDPTFPHLLPRGVTLAQLVVPNQTVPGYFWQTQENLLLTTTKLDGTGGYHFPPAKQHCSGKRSRKHKTTARKRRRAASCRRRAR